MRKRLRHLKRAIKTIVVDRDVFHQNSDVAGNPFTANAPFFFDSYGLPSGSELDNILNGGDPDYIADTRVLYDQQDPSDQLTAYQDWFQEQVDSGLLWISGDGEGWTNKYIESTYKKALIRSYNDVHGTGGISAPFEQGSRAEFLSSAFGSGVGQKQLQLLGTRCFQQLKGVTAAMEQQMSRILADGLAHGLGTKEIARNLNKVVTELGKKRALVLARTEISHAYAEGQLDSFEQSGVRGVGVMAEWMTAGDDRVCDACAPLEGIVLEIKEARMILPRHPNCRCVFLPAGVGESAKTAPHQKDDKESIEDALNKSILAQKRKGETLEEAKVRLSWSGVNKRIARDRYRTTGVRYRAGGGFVERDDEGELPSRPRRHEERIEGIPLAMGETPIPKDHIRFYHYTTGDKDDILADGILMKRAEGESYGEPSQIWAIVAGDELPENYNAKRYVEFSLHPDDPRIGGTIRAGTDKTQATFIGDILPSDIVDVYEPYDHMTREILEDRTPRGRRFIEKIRSGEYDEHIASHRPDDMEAIAMGEVKRLLADEPILKKIQTEIDKEAYREPETLRKMLKDLIENEGFSYDVKKDAEVQGGYMVSPYPELELIAFDNIKPEDMEDEDLKAKISEAMEKFIEKNADIIRDDPQAHFGAWWDTDKQRIYLDVVVRVETAEEAHALSVIYKQESYFDLNTFEEVKVGAREEDEKSSEADDIPSAKKGDEQADESGVDAADVRRAAGTERRKAAEERRQAEEEKGMKGVGEVDEEEELQEIEDELAEESAEEAEEKEEQRIKDLEDLREQMRKDLRLEDRWVEDDDDEEELSPYEKVQAREEREKERSRANKKAEELEKEIERLQLTMEEQTLHDVDIDEFIAMRKSHKDKTKELEDLYGEIAASKTTEEKQADLDKIVEQIKKRKAEEAKVKDKAALKKDFWKKHEEKKKLPEDMTPTSVPPANMSVGDINPDEDEFVRRVWGAIGNKGYVSEEHARWVGAMIHDQIILENPKIQELQDEFKRVKDRQLKSTKEANKIQKQSRDWLRKNDTPEQTQLRSFDRVRSDGKKIGLANYHDYFPIEIDGVVETKDERDIRVRKAIDEEYKHVTLKVNPFEAAQEKIEEQIRQDNMWILKNDGAYDREYGRHVMEMIPRIRETGIALGESNTYEDRPFFMTGEESDARRKDLPEGSEYSEKDTEYDSTIIRSAERISPYLPKDWVDLMGASYVDVTTEHTARAAFDGNRNIKGLGSHIVPISEEEPVGWNKYRSNLGKPLERNGADFVDITQVDERYNHVDPDTIAAMELNSVNDTMKLKLSTASENKKVIQSYIDEHIEKEVEDLREEVFGEYSRGSSFTKDKIKRQLEARGRKLDVHVDDLPEHEKEAILWDWAAKNIKMDRITAHELLHAVQHASGNKLTRLEREFLYSKWKKQEAKEEADDEAKRIKAGVSSAEWGIYGIGDREGLMNADDGWYKLTDEFRETYAGKMYRVGMDGSQIKPIMDVGAGDRTTKIDADTWLERSNPLELQSEAYEVMTVGVEDIFFGGYNTSEHKDFRDFTLGILFGF